MYSITSHIDSLREKHQQVVEKSHTQTEEYIKLLTQASIELPKIQKTFDKCGFHINDFVCVRTGILDDGDSIRIAFKILPKSPTYRYIKFDGYDKHGAGKNHSRLVKKATDLQDKIFQETGLKCQVNHYSFEIDRGKENGGIILVDFWIQGKEHLI